jgi:hypothetical protein
MGIAGGRCAGNHGIDRRISDLNAGTGGIQAKKQAKKQAKIRRNPDF